MVRRARAAGGSWRGRCVGPIGAGPGCERRLAGFGCDLGGGSGWRPSVCGGGVEPGRSPSPVRCRVSEARHSASTRPSSRAIAAPSAMFGETACAASPMSSTDPRDHPSRVTSSIGATCTAPSGPRESSIAGTGAANPPEARPASPHLVTRGRGASVGGRVAVAVDMPPADRHGQEGDLAAEQHRPRGQLRRALGDEAPGELSHRSDRAVADGEMADRGVDAVGTDDQVVAAGRAVGELDGDGAVVLAEPPHRRPIQVGTGSPWDARTSCRSARCTARQGPTSPHRPATSMSASRRPRWSHRRWCAISDARSAPRTPSPGHVAHAPRCLAGRCPPRCVSMWVAARPRRRRNRGAEAPGQRRDRRSRRRPQERANRRHYYWRGEPPDLPSSAIVRFVGYRSLRTFSTSLARC